MTSETLWEESGDKAEDRRSTAVREVHATADALQADIDRLTIYLRAGGTFPEMRNAVDAYKIHSETIQKLREVAEDIARGRDKETDRPLLASSSVSDHPEDDRSDKQDDADNREPYQALDDEPEDGNHGPSHEKNDQHCPHARHATSLSPQRERVDKHGEDR